MSKFYKAASTTAVLALAITLSAPAQAQLLRGGLGGGFGIGGGLPIGSIGAGGDIGISGAVDGTTRTARSTTRVAHAAKPAANAPRIAAPDRLAAPDLAARTVVVPAPRPGVGGLHVAGALHGASSLIVVPAVPDIAVRRAAIVAAGIAPVSYSEVPAYIDEQYVTLQNELRGTGVEVEKQGQQIVLEMPSDVTFAFNKYDIQPRFYGVLDAVSQTLAHYPASYVDVAGHTDAIGSLEYNQVLSEKRADSVADYLVARQVNPARLRAEGFGKTEPITTNATVAGRAANRRVEIILTPYAA